MDGLLLSLFAGRAGFKGSKISVLPFAVVREGVGARPMVLGLENAATSAAAKGQLIGMQVRGC